MIRRSLLAVGFVVLGMLSGSDAAAASPEGVWVGRCQIDDREVFVKLSLQRDGTEIKGAAFSRLLGIRAAPVAEVQADGNQVALSFQTAGGGIRLSCTLHDDELDGTVEHAGSSGRCSFRRRYDLSMTDFDAFRGDYQLAPDRVLFLGGGHDLGNRTFMSDGDLRVEISAVGPHEFFSEDLRTIACELDAGGTVVAAVVSQPGQSPRRAPRVQLYAQEPVTFANGAVRLAGRMLIPAGPGPHPALVFVHGSGPGTRHEDPFEADRFARSGIAVLAFDKRGVGESTGDWSRARFEDLADDVLAGVQVLRSDPRIRADKVGLWGISQAGWIIPLAASRSSDVAFIVPISGGAVTPSEQELWRQRQNLEYLGVPERFIGVERKVAMLSYDWDRQNRSGTMPIPNPFTRDQLDMFHDAPAVLGKVRQPVLAIFGGMDTLTPPRESAAVWADALRRSGNSDYSVRLFPRGSHGLMDGGKTGSPLELLPEYRLVPGFFDTMVSWIFHHAGGPAFAEVRQVDVADDDIPVESRGLDHVGWYGSGSVLPWHLVLSAMVFASAVVVWPVGWLWGRLRRGTVGTPGGSRRTPVLAALLSLLNLTVTAAMTFVLYMLVMGMPGPVVDHLGLIWNGLAGATWLSLLLLAIVCQGCYRAWRNGWWSHIGRVYYSVVALTGLAWVPFVIYWDLYRPTW